MNTGFSMRRLIQGLLGAAVATLLTVAHGHAPAMEPAFPPAAARLALGTGTQAPEWRAAREHTPRAPLEKAARTRRPSAAGGASALPAPMATGAVSAPVIRIIRGTAELVALRSECGHCTRAPRPPPIS